MSQFHHSSQSWTDLFSHVSSALNHKAIDQSFMHPGQGNNSHSSNSCLIKAEICLHSKINCEPTDNSILPPGKLKIKQNQWEQRPWRTSRQNHLDLRIRALRSRERKLLAQGYTVTWHINVYLSDWQARTILQVIWRLIKIVLLWSKVIIKLLC